MGTVAINSDSAVIPSVNLTDQGADPANPGEGHSQLYTKAGRLWLRARDIAAAKLLVLADLGVPVDWTPTVDKGGAVAMTVTEAKYILLGKWCQLWASLLSTGTGTAATHIVIAGIPPPAQMTASAYRRPVGSGYFQDAAPTLLEYWCIAFRGSATESLYFRDHITALSPGYTPNYALAAGDQISFSVGYPVP